MALTAATSASSLPLVIAGEAMVIDQSLGQTRAERMIGCEVRRLQEGATDGRVVHGAFRGDELIAEAAHFTDDFALQILVRQVYAIHSLEAIKQHGWRCARCRRTRRLQIHHRKYRSHGGTHRIENLEPVCWDCHKLSHTLERSA